MFVVCVSVFDCTVSYCIVLHRIVLCCIALYRVVLHKGLGEGYVALCSGVVLDCTVPSPFFSSCVWQQQLKSPLHRYCFIICVMSFHDTLYYVVSHHTTTYRISSYEPFKLAKNSLTRRKRC